MAVVQNQPNTENQQKPSLPRRIATYIASMNLTKVFRRHHPKESMSPIQKTSEKSSFIHPFHGYPRPFSYHIPATEQLSRTSLTKPSNIVPYRIGLTGDSSTILANGQTNENDDIVRLPIKTGKGHSPKSRKDRRYQSQLNANKRWLFRSMETLDGWKEKVFTAKHRTTDYSQSRSRSVENLADNNVLLNKNPSRVQEHERALSPNRSIEAITNRVINSIGIHRKSTNSISNVVRSPALTIEKQSVFNNPTNGYNNQSKPYNNTQNHNETSPSAILDFREISSVGFLHSRTRLNDDKENSSLTISEKIVNSINMSDDEVISNLSCITNGEDDDDDHNDDTNSQTVDPWDFSATWLDSLKEQHSPQRKIQFYENLIKLLEQDTLNIDELLVLRKILAKIWPTNDLASIDLNYPSFSMDSKPTITKSLNNPSKIKRRPKLSTMAHHTAQRCSAIIEPSLNYEPLHEQHNGHTTRPSSLLIAAKAKPCIIENMNDSISNQTINSNIEQNYPQHLNPFGDETDITPTNESDNNGNDDSIRRYFERLTLLETIYEKLNSESNGKPIESMNYSKTPIQEKKTEMKSSRTKTHSTEPYIEIKEDIRNHSRSFSSQKPDINKKILNKFVEMNVDGSGSVSSGKSSIKRRAPTAPHLSQTDKQHQQHSTNNSNMFSLSSIDLNLTHKTNNDTNTSTRLKTYDENHSRESNVNEHHPMISASCDDHGHIFVYDDEPITIQKHTSEEKPSALPKKTERIHQWLSSCEAKEQLDMQNNLSTLSQSISPKTQLKVRCTTKPIRESSLSPKRYQEKNNTPNKSIEDIEQPARFRTCLKINLEKNESTNQRSRTSSATRKYYQRNRSFIDDNVNVTDDEEYYESRTLSPSFQSDYQAVYL